MFRTRTISWDPPVDAARQADGLTGLEALHRIGNGLLPPPPVADLAGLHPIFVTPCYVVFASYPRARPPWSPPPRPPSRPAMSSPPTSRARSTTTPSAPCSAGS